MNPSLTRRNLLQTGLLAAGSSSFIGQVLAQSQQADVQAVFSHGVASGEPQADSVLLWTRVSVEQEKAVVEWELALDTQFRKLVQKGQLNAEADNDHCVKITVSDLEAGQVYYYRFKCQGIHSEPGRTRTLPQGDIDNLNIAIASCSNFPFGYFNAYEVIAADPDIQFVLHLGDYIYEYGHDGYGGTTGKVINRNHEPAHEIVSLADYRQRHAQYKADIASRLMHAAHPLIPTWDDHESTNNPYMQGAQNHQPDEGDWSKRRDASLKAYYEWMPIREPEKGLNRKQLWRHFQFGNLASLVTLETRHTGRSIQIDYKDHLGNIKSDEDRDLFLKQVLGNPARSMLSKNMKDFYDQSLKNNSSQWHLLGNQIPMARTHVPDISQFLKKKNSEGYDPVADEHAQFRRLGELDLPIYLDTWDGYPGARQAFYEQNQNLGIEDLLVLTGDSHSFWTNQLFDDSGKAMGVEIGTAGITSPGDFEGYGPETANAMDKLVAEHNPEIVWTDCQHRGFVKLSLSKEKAQADFISVSDILTEKYQVERIKRAVITKKGKSLTYTA
ncbi:alkaline phosphatase D family protein [Pseudoteredinibacter isoporae]|uniref:Phosphodiesterase/alkaline phosphatase D-like protein n=1 Tax=Pseudoteredinibacter isoporae TaxID=570281 RepID=A0A7X0JR78_9GAMM|nr:alkaline phosphatase D family protein [Pseudoteredinibacter isoporae]MBB6519880.1 phosphodiesterase/alkaline phosphatase D-like protein [Pseudoteredinibacter isoporae]NHO85458.1 alkaline phosphatase [Pseudoteredinibacter isoporae]NIB26090.1 alkaline phosphatase [Pseudoteredinibacter isoporae]